MAGAAHAWPNIGAFSSALPLVIGGGQEQASYIAYSSNSLAMSAYEDGYNGWQHAPSDNLSDADKTSWGYGKHARLDDERRAAEASKPVVIHGTGLSATGFLALVVAAVLWYWCSMAWERIKYFVASTDPTIALPLAIVFCALTGYWLFKKAKWWGSLWFLLSFAFLGYWTHAAIKNHQAYLQQEQELEAKRGLHREQFD
jgi:hypothetical protein